MNSEERIKILKMIQDGKITAEEGAKLLEALAEGEDTTEQKAALREGKTVKVVVTDRSSGKIKVNVKLPLGIARFVKNLVPPSEKMKLEQNGIDLDTLFQNLETGGMGKVVEFEDEEHNHSVEIWIE